MVLWTCEQQFSKQKLRLRNTNGTYANQKHVQNVDVTPRFHLQIGTEQKILIPKTSRHRLFVQREKSALHGKFLDARNDNCVVFHLPHTVIDVLDVHVMRLVRIWFASLFVNGRLNNDVAFQVGGRVHRLDVVDLIPELLMEFNVAANQADDVILNGNGRVHL